jgi:hypothetical protein
MIYPQTTFPFEICDLPFRAAEATLPSQVRLAKRPWVA